jgi:hypothetical protein
MPLSPRTLRPANNFTPKSISGLALWLDASSADTLYTTDAGPVTAVSSPLDITGCALWLDGADSSAASMTLDGTAVSTWKDKSGNGRDFTATSTARPTLTASAINSRSAVTFNGSTSTLTGNTAAQDVIRNLAGYTVFTVLRTATVAAGERLAFGVGATVLFRIGQQDSRPFMGGRRVSADTLESVTGTASDLSVGAAFIQTASVNHTSQSLTGLRNGATFASDATYMASGSSENVASSVSVGTQAGGTYGFWNGDIAEIVVFNTALSTADRARVEAYLAAKWGISGVHVPATATSDPVGYWADKSGNARHVTQSVSGSRPTISATKQNGRNALAFNGSSQSLSIASYNAENVLSGLTRYVVASMSSPAASAISRVTAGGGDSFFATVSGEIRFYGGASAYSAVASTTYGLLTSGTNIIGSVYDGTAGSVAAGIKPYYNGAAIPPSSTSGTLPTTLPGGTPGFWIGSNIGVNSFWPGRIIEYISYSRALGNAERQRLERYLAAKYGITLAPQVSNADAQDWINRVYANGGTVSASTASAVNTLCDSLDAASLRDRFYRLNLFCGTGLNAALVPLYRGPSLGGTQYGGATDTNNAFVGVGTDYAETGATGGLTGNGTTKSLNTGFLANTLTASDMHIGCGLKAAETAITGFRSLIGTFTGGNEISMYARPNGRKTFAYGGIGSELAGDSVDPTATGDLIAAFPTVYRNGVATGSNASSSVNYPSAHSFLVFAIAQNGTTPINHTNARINWYSIGKTMTATQAATMTAIFQAFQASMSRT